MKIGIKLLLCLALSGGAAAFAQAVPGNRACAAFSPDGSLATAKLTKSLLVVEVTPQSGAKLSLEMPLILSGDACHAFFSRDGALLAVSIEDKLHSYAHVQVAAADVHTGKWLQSTPYAAALADDARGPLVGFLGTTHTAMVMSGGTFFPDEVRSLIYPVFIELPEGKVHTTLVPINGPPFTSGSGAVDTAGSRIWSQTKQGKCNYLSVVLDGKVDAKPGPEIPGDQLRSAGCEQPALVVAPSPDALVIGFEKGNQFVVLAADVSSGSVQAATLTANGREGFFRPGNTVIAPSAKYFAIRFERFDETRSGLKRTATEAAIFAVAPFTLASSVRIPDGSEMAAINDGDGQLAVAVVDRKGRISVVKASRR